MNITDQPQGTAPAGPNGLARIERTFSNLFNLAKARAERPDQLRREMEARQTRSEAFKQVQREKWLGSALDHRDRSTAAPAQGSVQAEPASPERAGAPGALTQSVKKAPLHINQNTGNHEMNNVNYTSYSDYNDSNVNQAALGVGPTALLLGIEAMVAQLAHVRIDQIGNVKAPAPAFSATEAARQEEMATWLRSYQTRHEAANDASPLETHKKMWLELVS